MHKDFYIGRKDGEHSRSLDVSPFSSFEQLTATLAEVFAFADTKCVSCFCRHIMFSDMLG